ncbi:unnamed protein product [Thelazia callipaeda]|uniref:NAD-dependent protein deacetylase n=1 Tax=Thelazia callipaeda TaxID=103827 RepID=A0A0N5D4N1_THECL|nr:unnamed protein product [Thelazia callipaeda]
MSQKQESSDTKEQSDEDHGKFEEQKLRLEEKSSGTSGDEGSSPDSSSIFRSLISKFGNLSANDKPNLNRQKLSSLTIEGVVEYILDQNIKNIIVLTGAGISTSAGVPDFRSPGTGLYDNVAQYNLSNPMLIFDISYFMKNPEPFYKLAKNLFPTNLKPTPCHYLIRLMDEKGLLLRWYTQNIDSLEFMTGIHQEKLVAAHGCHHSSTCLSCYAKYDQNWIMNKLFQENVNVAYCEKCGGIVKPDIVFFGENLPVRFFSCSKKDFPKCDLLIIMGTSLVVQPFAGLLDAVKEEVPRLLINLTEVGRSIYSSYPHSRSGLCYGDEDNYRDVFWRGTTDDGAWKLAELLGWKQELEQLIKKEWDKIELKNQEKAKKVSCTTERVSTLDNGIHDPKSSECVKAAKEKNL